MKEERKGTRGASKRAERARRVPEANSRVSSNGLNREHHTSREETPQMASKTKILTVQMHVQDDAGRAPTAPARLEVARRSARLSQVGSCVPIFCFINRSWPCHGQLLLSRQPANPPRTPARRKRRKQLFKCVWECGWGIAKTLRG
jgi:hypothetical protein